MKIKSLTREKHNLMYMYLCASKKIHAEANQKRKEDHEVKKNLEKKVEGLGKKLRSHLPSELQDASLVAMARGEATVHGGRGAVFWC
jgi:hypothetical protein